MLSPHRDRPVMEPYCVKVVEPLPITTRQQREALLANAGFNLFNLKASDVTIDLLSDSGTGALSAAQLAGLMIGDEAYAGSDSFERFATVVHGLTGFEHVIPVHQGRAAERVLFSMLLKPGDLSLSNAHFDTTRANVELCGGEARDLPCAEAEDLRLRAPFKGNIDLDALERTLSGPERDRVAVVIMTITNNTGGGQPVSIDNLEGVRELCTHYGVPFWLDAARFAENAWFVTQRDPAFAGVAPRTVAERVFRMADGVLASLKKDGLGHIGGLLALHDSALAQRCGELIIATEGFLTYGGLAGRDLEALAQGLIEVTDPQYLRSRAAATAYLAALAEDAGVPTVRPAGCHAVYIDAGALLPHVPPDLHPALALGCALYLEGGIRGCDLGTLAFGRVDDDGRLIEPARHELLRLAVPRRVYTQSHLEYVGDMLGRAAAQAAELPGYRIVSAPRRLRHFSARLEPAPVANPLVV